jgi:NTE family protein
MSVGVAAGLAHFGVLEVLEDAGVPLDFVCGSSMGGIAALGYALLGDARAAQDVAIRHLRANDVVKDTTWLPRSSLLVGRKVRQLREEVFGSATFSQLQCPAAVVAADLVAGQRVVINRGLVADAAHATSAIPGLFPPLVRDGRVLADGGVVTRVPVDVLSSRRCGYRIAVTVRPPVLANEAERERQAAAMEAAMGRPLGLRSVLAASWKLLGWWDSESQARQADSVITVSTSLADAFNFAAGSRLVEVGRAEARRCIADIRQAVEKVLASGTP